MRVSARQSWRRFTGLREQSRLLTFVIALFMVGYLALAFWLFLQGLWFVARFPGLGNVLVERAIVRTVMCLSGFGVLSLALGWAPYQIGMQRVKTFEV